MAVCSSTIRKGRAKSVKLMYERIKEYYSNDIRLSSSASDTFQQRDETSGFRMYDLCTAYFDQKLDQI